MNVEGFQADILAEPEALVRVADAYGSGGLPAVDGRRVLLIGMGSSTYASHTAAALLRARGHDAHVELASTGTPQPPAPDTLALVVSASGGSEETVEAMARHSGVSTVVAVTNRDDSELARGADVVIPVLAGPESGGIACRSYVCTLAVLLLAAGADGDAVRRAAESSAGLIARRSEWLPPLADLAEGGAGVWASAPAERIGSSLQSALMLREAPRIVADGCETGRLAPRRRLPDQAARLSPAADARIAVRRRRHGVARGAGVQRRVRRSRGHRGDGDHPDRRS